MTTSKPRSVAFKAATPPKSLTNRKSASNTQKKMREIGRWYIGETLGKGGYSWVKKGFDKKTGKCVALKFMAKADETWVKEQAKQVVAEIESLKQIRHPHVMKLYAFNLNARYPTLSAKKLIDTILLVLEFAPGGELFDILYYTSALETVLARTYFRQAMYGLEACHNAGVAHRDVKPQNLLLDSRFNLKITDFGLSKVFESDADATMETTYVGTQGYQAPELLLERPYDLACDVFSMGVVLFILLTGYPPFAQALASDRWFKPLVTNNFAKFWKNHHGCAIEHDPLCQRLLQRMLSFDPKQRITVAQIKRHPWFVAKHLGGQQLIGALRHRHKAMELKRRNDSTKMRELNHSFPPSRRPMPGHENIECELFPGAETEGIYDTYTTTVPTQFANAMTHIIELHNGTAVLNDSCTGLDCRLRIMPHRQKQQMQQRTQQRTQQRQSRSTTGTGAAANSLVVIVAFTIQWWQSREFFVEEADESTEMSSSAHHHSGHSCSHALRERVFIIRMRRIEGALATWQGIRKLLFKKASALFTGLPAWTAAVRTADQFPGTVAEADIDQELEEDEYDNIMVDWTENNNGNGNQN